MEFSLKVQHLGEETSEGGQYQSIAHEFEVPDQTLLKKRGRLFITVGVRATGDFNLKEAVKLFIDNIQESYYRQTEDTPLHAIEKALNRAAEIVRTVKSKDGTLTLGSREAKFHLSFCTILIWNRVLYASYLGNPAIYLIRGTGVRNLGLNPANNEIWTNSAILDDTDVIIAGTEAFAQEFPPQEISSALGGLSLKISESEHKDEISALIIKVLSEKERSTSSIIDKIGQVTLKNSLSNSVWQIKDKISRKEKLSDKFKLYQSKKSAPVSSISGLVENQAPAASNNKSTGPIRINGSGRGTKKKTQKVTLGLLALLSVGYINYKLFYNIQSEEPKVAETLISSNISGAQVKGTSSEKPKSDIHDLFIRLNDISPRIDDISLSSNVDGILVLDISNNELYSIPVTGDTRQKISEDFKTTRTIECDEKLCYILSDETFYVINPKTPEKVDKYILDANKVVDIYPYGNALYVLTAEGIKRHTIGQKSSSSKDWLAKNQSVQDPKSMAIDGNIYILESRDIAKYIEGKKSNFKIDNSHLLNPTEIETDGRRLYVLDNDKTEKKIVIYDSLTGAFEREIKLSEDLDTEDITTFTITKTSKKSIFFKKGQKLFKVDL